MLTTTNINSNYGSLTGLIMEGWNMRNKIVISLYDVTGESVRPWAEQGYQCHCYDILNNDTVEHCGRGVIFYHYADLETAEALEDILALAEDNQVVFLSAFPPCTDLAVSGAKHFKSKAAKNPYYRMQAMNLVYVADSIGKALGCPYYIENPVSVISTEWRKPDYTFHPWHYGKYISMGDAVHPKWPQTIAARDAYPKLTCLWTGNDFVMPVARPVEVSPGYSAQFKKLGGKSLKTKMIRSATPRGFARAVYQANAPEHREQYQLLEGINNVE